MITLAGRIEETIRTNAPHIRSIADEQFEYKPSPAKWSKKEILGHLVDSAQNNIQRLVRGQYEHNPKIVYDQDQWVKLADYQSYNREELVQLWVLLNKHFCKILISMNDPALSKQCDTGKGFIELHTLQFIADDYLAHMKHHLNQMLQTS